MRNFLIIFIPVVFILMTFPTRAEENPGLEFLISGKEHKEIKLFELENKLDSQIVKINDPVYKKEKKYMAFPLSEVLNLAYDDEWKNNKYSDIAFSAADGYEAVSDISKLKESGGYLAFRDMDYEKWEPIGEKKADPSPFYIVWKGKDQLPESGYPWPWQLETINLILFKDRYPAVYPDGVSTDSAVFKGYEIFKQRCLRCHSINREGGKVGPDLNSPMNILEYRSANMVKEFIRIPSKYRHTYMPDNPDLSDKQLDSIVDFLWYIRNKSR